MEMTVAIYQLRQRLPAHGDSSGYQVASMLPSLLASPFPSERIGTHHAISRGTKAAR